MTNDNQRELVGHRVYIYPRGKKRIYTADFWYEGEHYRRSLKTPNKKIARQRAVELDHKISKGEFTLAAKPQKTRSMPVAEAISRFISFHETEGSQPKTVTKYRGILKRFQTFATSHKIDDLEKISLDLIDRYRESRKPNLSPKSMHLEGSLLKLFLTWCTERQWIHLNPLADRAFKTPRVKPRVAPSLAEVNLILTKATEARFPPWAMLAFTGMRSGELQRLQPKDIDWEGNWIHIVSREGAETKTGESRKVPIHPRLRLILEELPTHKRPWLFTSLPSSKYPDGDHQINTKRLNDDLLLVLKKLDLPAGRQDGGYTVHSFRHFFRTHTVNAGVPERMVDMWLGHAPDRSMGSVYYHPSDEESQRFIRHVSFG